MYGELAYGEKGKKSSANPDKCQALEGIYDHQVTFCTGSFLQNVPEQVAKLHVAELQKTPGTVIMYCMRALEGEPMMLVSALYAEQTRAGLGNILG